MRNAEPPTDEVLMAAYIAGDESAFRDLFARYAPALERLMARDLYRPEDARDLVQQTFLQFHRARLDFVPAEPVRPWLFTIALNLKREYFRRRRRRPESALELDWETQHTAQSGGAARFDAEWDISRKLSLLPAEQREVIQLHWFSGLSFPEVAAALGESVSAVKVRAHRGYVRLRELLADSEPESLEPP